MGSGSRRKTALAEGVCFSVLELFHFLPRPAACALQNGCSMCLPGWSHGPSLLLPSLRRGSVLQTLQLCQVQREALTHGWSESHLIHSPWSCARTSVSLRTVWRWVSGSVLDAVEWAAGFSDRVPYQGRDLLLARDLLPLQVSQTHTATPIVRVADSVDLGYQQVGSCHFQLRPPSHSQVPGHEVNFSR